MNIDLISIDNLRQKPMYAFFLAALFVFLGFLFALFIFPSAFSIAMVSFSSLLILPYIIKVILRKVKRFIIVIYIFNRY